MRYLRETPAPAPPPPPETRLEIVTPATDDPDSFALSPDGRQIVFVASGGGASRLWLRSLATTTAQPLAGTEGATLPFWSPDSRSVGFFAGGSLKRLDLGGGAPQTQASGTARETLGDPDGTFLNPYVSPDGRRVVVTRAVQGNSDLWLLDGTRTSRFTFDAAPDLRPVWSPDGTKVVFLSSRTGVANLFQKLTSRAGVEERIVASDQTNVASSWSADGRFLLYNSQDPQTDSDLWVVSMVGKHTPSVFLKTPSRELHGAFSPDGRWVAYQSNESGQSEVYVRPFVPPSRDASADKPGGQWQVSTAGGIHPAWRRDGKELYYLNPAGAMIAAPIAVTGATFEPGAPVELFPTQIVGGGVDEQIGRQYDVAPDGRFLINTELPGDAAPITLIQHWNPEAKQ